MKIGIISLGYGNIYSIAKMLDYHGFETKLITEEACLTPDVTKLILPGVGSFDRGINAIHEAGLFHKIIEFAKYKQLPILGICLGMHLLCKSSQEGVEQGLGLIDAVVKKIREKDNTKLRLPHVGWRWVKKTKKSFLFPFVHTKERYYFTHSYTVALDDTCHTTSLVNYGFDLCASFESENIFGVQFHPE